MIVLAPGTSPSAPATPTPAPDADALALWDDNGNGRITCAEARAHGIAPVHRGTRRTSTCVTRTATAWCENNGAAQGEDATTLMDCIMR